MKGSRKLPLPGNPAMNGAALFPLSVPTASFPAFPLTVKPVGATNVAPGPNRFTEVEVTIVKLANAGTATAETMIANEILATNLLFNLFHSSADSTSRLSYVPEYHFPLGISNEISVSSNNIGLTRGMVYALTLRRRIATNSATNPTASIP